MFNLRSSSVAKGIMRLPAADWCFTCASTSEADVRAPFAGGLLTHAETRITFSGLGIGIQARPERTWAKAAMAVTGGPANPPFLVSLELDS
jgi:hypothetical protein